VVLGTLVGYCNCPPVTTVPVPPGVTVGLDTGGLGVDETGSAVAELGVVAELGDPVANPMALGVLLPSAVVAEVDGSPPAGAVGAESGALVVALVMGLVAGLAAGLIGGSVAGLAPGVGVVAGRASSRTAGAAPTAPAGADMKARHRQVRAAMPSGRTRRGHARSVNCSTRSICPPAT
jgi:hypothetical protein